MIAEQTRAALVHDRTMLVSPRFLSGVTPRKLWVMWYETAETVVVKVLDTHGCWWARQGDVLLVPPHCVEPITLVDGTIYVCHEANAIARIEGTGR